MESTNTKMNSFQDISSSDLAEINGGFFPIVIAGVVISKTALAWGAGALAAGGLTGYLINKK